MIGLTVAAHELHGGPILPAFVRMQIQPGQMPQVARQFRAQSLRQGRIIFGHFAARAPAAAVGQKRQIQAASQSGHIQGLRPARPTRQNGCPSRWSRAAPRPCRACARHGGESPVLVHDRMILADPELTADTEAGFPARWPGQLVAMGVDQVRGLRRRRSSSCGRRCPCPPHRG
jgi:hypothetical protein